MLPILLVTSVLLGLVLAYLLWVKDWDYWEKREVVAPKPSFPYGNVKPVYDGKETFADFFSKLANKWPEEPLIGFYSFFSPMLMINDAELVKDVLVQDFPKFVDNAFELSSADKLIKKISFWIKGHKAWKEARSRFTPSLTTSKQKAIVPIMIESTERHFHAVITQNGSGELEVLDAAKLTLQDSMLRISFSIDVDLIEEKRDPNSKYKQLVHGEFFRNSELGQLAFIAAYFSPWYLKMRSLTLMPEETQDFYIRFVNSCVEMRKKSQEQRNDILQAIINIEKKKISEGKPGFTREEWASNMLTVMVDSTETTLLALKFILFELARHPDEQKKLRTEVLKAGASVLDFDYDKLTTVRRLDMFINESMRFNPPILLMGRKCMETTKIGNVVVEKGTSVFIAPPALHMNPKYHPDPTTFNPERFADPGSIKSCTFMPFGEGPRACLGQRYATLALKILLIKIILTFDVSLNDDLTKPLKSDKKSPFVLSFEEEPKWKFTRLH